MAVHVVLSGDTLSKIATMYGVSVQTIMGVNGLPSANALVPGLALYLPDNMLPSRMYRIKAGDTLWRIAQQFNTTITAVLTANPGINPNNLYIGQIITIPSPMKQSMGTLGFMIPTTFSVNNAVLTPLANQLTYLAVVAYFMTNEGWAYNHTEDRALVAKSKELKVTPLLVLQNFVNGDFSAELAGRVLENPTYRANLIASLVNLAKQRGYSGVSIDLEFIPPPRRQDFIIFLSDLKKALGTLLLHVNVHSKTQDIPTNRIIGAYDYAAIANVADLVAVMTMDYGYSGGPPDPITPVNWLEQVIQYSLTQIPREKMQVALPLYAYDKVVPTNATNALSVLAAQNQAITKWAPIQFDNASKAPWYQYWDAGIQHVVWFEDIRSYIEMYRLVDLYQIAGVTYWELSLPAPQNWAYLRKNITVVKR